MGRGVVPSRDGDVVHDDRVDDLHSVVDHAVLANDRLLDRRAFTNAGPLAHYALSAHLTSDARSPDVSGSFGRGAQGKSAGTCVLGLMTAAGWMYEFLVTGSNGE